jgi:hypothetical protein
MIKEIIAFKYPSGEGREHWRGAMANQLIMVGNPALPVSAA